MFGLTFSQTIVAIKRAPQIKKAVIELGPEAQEAWPHVEALVAIFEKASPKLRGLVTLVEDTAHDLGYPLNLHRAVTVHDGPQLDIKQTAALIVDPSVLPPSEQKQLDHAMEKFHDV